MNLPKLRKGHTYRIYDAGKWSLILDHGYAASSVAAVSLVFRSKRSGIKRVTIPVQIQWRTAYRLRKFGALYAYGVQGKLIHKLFTV